MPDHSQIEEQEIINHLIDLYNNDLISRDSHLFKNNLLYTYKIENNCLIFYKQLDILPNIINLGSVQQPQLVIEYHAPKYLNHEELTNYLNQLQIGNLYLNYYQNLLTIDTQMSSETL